MSKNIITIVLVLSIVGALAVGIASRPQASPTSEPAAATHAPAGNGNGGNANNGTPQSAGTSSVGEVWSGSGTILNLTTVGMTLALKMAAKSYVELGSPDYWQAQGVTLNAGAAVAVDGFFNGTNYHARTVTTSDGAVLALRSEAGNRCGRAAVRGSNGGQGEVQIPADQWVTVTGTVTALTNNGVIMQTSDAQSLTISFGRADFWQAQAVTFAAGDAITLLGFWQADQFNVGQVTKTDTDERIMLRDPNGRPLWAGPGRGNGNGSGGQGQGSHGTPQPTVEATLAPN